MLNIWCQQQDEAKVSWIFAVLLKICTQSYNYSVGLYVGIFQFIRMNHFLKPSTKNQVSCILTVSPSSACLVLQSGMKLTNKLGSQIVLDLHPGTCEAAAQSTQPTENLPPLHK